MDREFIILPQTRLDVQGRRQTSNLEEPRMAQRSRLQPSHTKASDRDAKSNSKTSHPQPHLLPYNWRRSETMPVHRSTNLMDRSYKNAYGGQLSQPYDLRVQCDMPLLKQKTDAQISLGRVGVPSDRMRDKLSLPPEVTSKIYSQLHQGPQDKRCMYVIKNMRRSQPASKPSGLPTILPLYHVQLVKTLNKIADGEKEKVEGSSETAEPQVTVKPMLKDKKTIEENLPGRTVRSANSQLRSIEDLEVGDCLTSKVYKSVDTYNQLLIEKHRQQQSKQKPVTQSNSHRRIRKPKSARRAEHKAVTEDSKQMLHIPDFITAVSISHKSAWAGVK